MVGATQPALAEKKPGMYICRVSDQQDHYVFSSWARIKVHPIKSGLPHAWQGSLVIGLQPESQTVRVGHRASLRCIAFGIPAPSYQWYRNGTPLPHHRKEEMLIPHTELRDQGTYLCAVTSDRGGEECWSCPADVSVGNYQPLSSSPLASDAESQQQRADLPGDFLHLTKPQPTPRPVLPPPPHHLLAFFPVSSFRLQGVGWCFECSCGNMILSVCCIAKRVTPVKFQPLGLRDAALREVSLLFCLPKIK
uniref:Ig-like domain-containing protein n=1 Tax=Callorhinchus milii TaxID=7868 RepID=A0A4W3H0N3_CALMI